MVKANLIESDEYTIALLIDAENISYKYMDELLEQLKAFGRISIKRVYGDFTSPSLAPWKKLYLDYSLKLVQSTMNTARKNNSDSALIIDAMDFLHEHKVNAFCLATSDSDFTALAIRMSEEGLWVIGAGEEKTSKAFINTCDRFIKLGGKKKSATTAKSAPAKKKEKTSKKAEPVKEPEVVKEADKQTEILENIKARSLLILDNRGSGDFVKLSIFINDLYRFYPDFDCRDYGFRSNKEMFTNLGFTVKPDEKGSLTLR